MPVPADRKKRLVWTRDASNHVDILIRRLSTPGADLSESKVVRYALALAVGADTALVLGVPAWGPRVRAARAGAGLSQGELAAELGFSSRGTIGNVETGRWPPPPRLVEWVEAVEAENPVPVPARAPRVRRARLPRPARLLNAPK
jgi:DNA-binding XRE family transcriptional regulator